MPVTKIRGGPQLDDGSIVRSDLNVTDSGNAVIRKIIAGSGISLSSTGADSGTGDVTVTLNAGISNITGLQAALDNKFDKTGGTISGSVNISSGGLNVTGDSLVIGILATRLSSDTHTRILLDSENIRIAFGSGSASPDLYLQRISTNEALLSSSLRIQHSSGLVLTAPNGTTQKGITVSNAGEFLFDGTSLFNFYGTTQGSVLYRGSTSWTTLNPGTSGQALVTGGSGQNPSWQFIDASTLTGTLSPDRIGANALNLTKLQTVASGSWLARSSSGTGNIEVLTTTQAKTLLNLAISDISGLQTALDGKANTSHTHTTSDITGVATQTIVGRNTSGTGSAEQLSAATVRTILGLATIATSGSASDLSTGTLPTARLPAFTGDVTSTAGSNSLTVATNAVTFSKFQQISQNTLLGRVSSGTGNVEALTNTQAKSLLAIGISDVSGLQTALDGKSNVGHTHSGLAPAGGTTGQVLTKNTNTDYDYSWQTVSGGGGGGTPLWETPTLVSGYTYSLSGPAANYFLLLEGIYTLEPGVDYTTSSNQFTVTSALARQLIDGGETLRAIRLTSDSIPVPSGFYIDMPPPSPNSLDREFGSTTGITLWNPGNRYSLNIINSGLSIRTDSAPSGVEWGGAYFSLPTTNQWSLFVKTGFVSNAPAVITDLRTVNWGVGLLQNTTNSSQIVTLANGWTGSDASAGRNTHIFTALWSSYTTFSTEYNAVYYGAHDEMASYFRITKNGTNYTFWFSRSGTYWSPLHSGTLPWTPAVGALLVCNGSNRAGLGAAAHFYNLRFTESADPDQPYPGRRL